MNHTSKFLGYISDISEKINVNEVESVVEALLDLRANGGRVFFLGVGGSAANCSHAVNDFRKLCEIECYSATDNVSELTARINDDGWDDALVSWLKISKLNEKDAIFILSVGGGSLEKKVSVNLVRAIDYSKKVNAKSIAIVGRDGGYAKLNCSLTIHIPDTESSLVTPLAESFQAIVWHSIVSNPKIQIVSTKW